MNYLERTAKESPKGMCTVERIVVDTSDFDMTGGPNPNPVEADAWEYHIRVDAS